MFGIFRTYLACLVVWSHYGVGGPAGSWAVVSFFALSGFLMTAVMTGTYGYSLKGMVRFAANRGLRLFPSYYFLLAIIVAALLLRPEFADTRTHLPDTLEGWVANLSLLYPSVRPVDYFPRLIAPTWALTIELVFYGLIALGLSRSLRSTLLWAVVSVGLGLYLRLMGHISSPVAYGTVLDGALPFSLGALAFHLRAPLAATLQKVAFGHLWMLGILFAANQIVGMFAYSLFGEVGWTVRALGSWLNLGLTILLLGTLFPIKASKRSRAVDAAVGRFSYPIYLAHMPAYLLLSWFVPGLGPVGQPVAAVTLMLALSTACAYLIDRPIDVWRHRVRQQNSPVLARV